MSRPFAFVAGAFLITMIGTTLPTPLYPIYQAQLGFSGLTVTVIFATYAAGVITALLLFGNLSDTIGRKRTLLPGLALSAASAIVFLLAHGLAPLLVGRFLSGMSAGIFTGTATATLIELDPRPRASLIATAVNMGGLGLGPPLAGVLAEVFSHPLRVPYAVDLVLVALVAAGLATIPGPDNPGRVRIRPQALQVPPEIRATFLRSTVAGFAGFAVLGLFTAVSPAFLGKVLAVTNHAAIGGVVLVVFAASLAGQVARRRFTDRQALAGGCTVLIVGMALLATSLQVESLLLLIIGGVIAGLGQGLSFAAALAAVAAGAPEDQRAATTSSLFVLLYIAISVPVIGVGVLAQATSLVTAGTVFSAIVAALALGAALSLARRTGTTSP